MMIERSVENGMVERHVQTPSIPSFGLDNLMMMKCPITLKAPFTNTCKDNFHCTQILQVLQSAAIITYSENVNTVHKLHNMDKNQYTTNVH